MHGNMHVKKMDQSVAVVISLSPSNPSCLYIQQSSQRNSVCTFVKTRLKIFHYPQTLYNSAHRYSVSVKFSATISRVEMRIYTDSSRMQYARQVLFEQFYRQPHRKYYSHQVPLACGTQNVPEKDRFISDPSSLFLLDQTEHYLFLLPRVRIFDTFSIQIQTVKFEALSTQATPELQATSVILKNPKILPTLKQNRCDTFIS